MHDDSIAHKNINVWLNLLLDNIIFSVKSHMCSDRMLLTTESYLSLFVLTKFLIQTTITMAVFIVVFSKR